MWDLGKQELACSLKWESDISALSVIPGTPFMFVRCTSISVYIVCSGVPLALSSSTTSTVVAIHGSKHSAILCVGSRKGLGGAVASVGSVRTYEPKRRRQ